MHADRPTPPTDATAPRRAIPLVVVTLLLATLLPSAAADAAEAPTIEGPTTVAPAPDYASEAFSDPWDYANREDVLLDPNGPTVGLSDQRLEDGRLKFDVTGEHGGYFWGLYLPVPGALSGVRDGPDNPIDAGRYTHGAVRMYRGSTKADTLMRWFTCEEYTDACSGGRMIHPDRGWHTYVFELESGTSLPQEWTGAIRGLRFDVQYQGAEVEIDWIRLYRPAGVTRVESDGESLYWDADADRSNNTSRNPGWGELDGSTFDHSAYPPGTYRFYSDSGPYSEPLTIDRAPLPVIDDPDEVGGEDYAASHLRDPWDMSGPGDAAELGNVRDVSWSGGQLHATNDNNDPFVRLRLAAGGIDTSRYHRLTVEMSYDGEFDLGFEPGGGTHGRAIWWRADTGDWDFHNSREILTFTDRDTYTIDLARPGVPESGDGAWTGSTATYLRWDPNEDPGARRWRLDDVQLRADDEARERFDVRWHDPTGNVGADVELWVDANRSGFDGRKVADGITQQDGQNAYRWNVGDDLPGRWWLHTRVDNGTSVGRQYARGPLYVEPRLAGADRDETAIRMSRNAFPEGAPAAVVAYDRDFPDALAAAPLAAAAGGPVLLNPRDQLHEDVRAELERLGAETVYLMGGPVAQSRQVEDALRRMPGVTVHRVSGSDRYGTGAEAAEEAVKLWRQQGIREAGSHALIALGTSFPDALAAGPLAAAARRPLLLTGGGSVPDATNDMLRQLGTDAVTAIGGSGVIPDSTLRQVGDGDTQRARIGGANRYHTSRLVADAAVSDGAAPGTVVVALGEDFPDALAAGPAVAARGGVLLLTPRGGVAEDTRLHLESQRGELDWLRVAGGPFAVRAAAVDGLLHAAGLPR